VPDSVVIIGAGINGLVAANYLRRAGCDVTVIDRADRPGGACVSEVADGDVHDIGKSLVNTILSNNGYTVYDLGKQVPVNTIIDKAVEVGRYARSRSSTGRIFP
jgi:phytoene dehydrogenase-like protein